MTELAEVFEAHRRGILGAAHTGVPAKVTAYDPVTNTLACDIVIKEALFLPDGEREFDTHPSLINVPVMWPRMGGFVVRGNIESGDYVWLAFSEGSLAEWRATGQLSEPTDARRLSLGYPFAIPGAFPDTSPMSPIDAVFIATGGLIVGEDGGKQFRISPLGIELSQAGVPAISPIALAVPLLAFVSASAAASAASGAADTAAAATLTLIGAALTAIAAALVPPNPAAVAAAAAAVTAIGASGTAQAAAATAGTAAAGAAATAAGAVPSTIVKSI